MNWILDSSSSLPSLFGNIPCTNFKGSSVILARVMGKEGNEWSNVVRGERLINFCWHNHGSHSSSGERSDAVGSDVSLLSIFICTETTTQQIRPSLVLILIIVDNYYYLFLLNYIILFDSSSLLIIFILRLFL